MKRRGRECAHRRNVAIRAARRRTKGGTSSAGCDRARAALRDLENGVGANTQAVDSRMRRMVANARIRSSPRRMHNRRRQRRPRRARNGAEGRSAAAGRPPPGTPTPVPPAKPPVKPDAPPAPPVPTKRLIAREAVDGDRPAEPAPAPPITPVPIRPALPLPPVTALLPAIGVVAMRPLPLPPPEPA